MSRILALIAARNEADVIAETIAAVAPQVDEVIVVANNCTDDTSSVAHRAGATVLDMYHNPSLKAGALNYGLGWLDRELADDDLVMILDADTVLSQGSVRQCLEVLDAHDGAGACGTVFVGRQTANPLGWLQAMEYHRYRRQLGRRGWHAFVLSGTASLFRVAALRAVRDRHGRFYETGTRVEDFHITLDLLALGYACPVADVEAVTDVMDTPHKLWRQRERWFGGALESLRIYGRSLPWFLKWVYWRQQVGLMLACVLPVAIVGSLLASGERPSSSWLPAVGLLAIERTFTAWGLGWRHRLLAATVGVEYVYSLFLASVFAYATVRNILGKRGHWHHT